MKQESQIPSDNIINTKFDFTPEEVDNILRNFKSYFDGIKKDNNDFWKLVLSVLDDTKYDNNTKFYFDKTNEPLYEELRRMNGFGYDYSRDTEFFPYIKDLPSKKLKYTKNYNILLL